MKRFSPEERRGVVAVVTIALVLCLCGLGLNYCERTPDKEMRIEVTTIDTSDSIASDQIHNKPSRKSKSSKRAGAKKGKRKKRDKAVSSHEPVRDLLSDTITTRY